MKDKFVEIARLAEARRVVRLGYKRPGEPGPHESDVEPSASSTRPLGRPYVAGSCPPSRRAAPTGGDFRLDRITSVADAGRAFRPRSPVTLGREIGSPGGSADETPSGAGVSSGPFVGWGDRPIAQMGPAYAYFRYLEDAMLDAKVTPDEMAMARSLGDRVEAHERKAAHARVFANVLHEVLQDSRITHREELYLQMVRRFLEEVGWAP